LVSTSGNDIPLASAKQDYVQDRMKTASLLRSSAGLRSRIALRCGAKQRTFGELEQRSNQLANALLGYGLEQDGCLAIICRNSVEFVETVLGAEKAGLRASIINPMAGRRDMEAALRCCSPRAVVANVSSAVEVVEACSDVAVKIFVGDALGFDGYEAALAGQSYDPVKGRSPGLAMPLTSGTTGFPKAIYRRQANVPPYLRQLLALTAFDATTDVAMAPCGLQGSGVYNLAVGLPLKAGVGVIIPDISVTMDLDPEEVLRTIEAERVTHLYLPNYIMRLLLALPEATRNRHDLGSLKCVLHTGSPCPIALKSVLIEWLGPIVTEIYAGAEGGGTLITSSEWLKHKGSVGKPAEGLVKMLAAETDDASNGKIYFHVPRHQRFEYFNNRTATEAAYHGDYFTLGDLGHFDSEGYLYLTGRMSEVIDFSGYNVFPAEIDATLLEHPAVAACAATGIPDEAMGETVGAVVVLQDGFTESAELTGELLSWCRSRLSISKCPCRLVYRSDIAGFAQGKVNRRGLRALFQTSFGEAVDG
jgi:long-chain acyl-CoA synthetase